MNDSPGWASPGSAPSDEPGRGGPAPAPGTPDGPPPGGQGGGWGAPGGWDSPKNAQGHGGPGGSGSPGGGWGGPSGWGSGWAQPPAAAKPGIIPLRPLGVGEILDGAVSAMRAHWRTVLGVSLAVAVVTQTVATLSAGVWFRDATSVEGLQNNPNPTFSETVDAIGGSLGSVSVTWLIGLIGTIVATAMLTIVVSRAVLGRPVSTADAWRSSRPRLPRLFGLLFLLPLLIIGVAAVALAPGIALSATDSPDTGAALILIGGVAAMVAALWLWIRFSLAAPALMLERQGVIASLRRSAKLVGGSWWRVFGIQLLTVVLILFVSAVVEIPTGILAMLVGGNGAADWLTGEAPTSWGFLAVSGVGAVISSTITFPISAGVTALLYMDQRIRREALDLELARAAGVGGYGVPQSDGRQPHDPAPGS